MIDVFSENVFPIRESPKRIPSRPHVATVIRWWQRGCRGVRLETCLIGGIRHTSEQAVQRFVDATTIAGSAGASDVPAACDRRENSIRAASPTSLAIRPHPSEVGTFLEQMAAICSFWAGPYRNAGRNRSWQRARRRSISHANYKESSRR